MDPIDASPASGSDGAAFVLLGAIPPVLRKMPDTRRVGGRAFGDIEHAIMADR